MNVAPLLFHACQYPCRIVNKTNFKSVRHLEDNQCIKQSFCFFFLLVSVATGPILWVSCVCTYWICKYCLEKCTSPEKPDLAPTYEAHPNIKGSASVKNKPTDPSPDYPGAVTANMNVHQNRLNYDYENTLQHLPT